ncbi:MAG TPA: DNA-directed RNA polymerase subunit alpha C-terminal domain-containing protein [Anaerolineales bacterium]|nr:DNA-directed RNA polymerase subunit alpha C-terminal domain-containing protein [Anaerolineales bacterium]
MAEVDAREAEKVSPEIPIAELELGKRAEDALARAGITRVGQALDRLAMGDAAMLAVDGFGQKSLVDLKRRLRAQGFELPTPEAPESEPAG